MKKDLHTKQILAQSTEPTGADFTAAVMRQVLQSAGATKAYTPLVSAPAKKLFLLLFGFIAAGALLAAVAMGGRQSLFMVWLEESAITSPEHSTYLQLALISCGMLAAAMFVQRLGAPGKKAW